MNDRRRQVLSRLHFPSGPGEAQSVGYFMRAEDVVEAANAGPKFANQQYELGEYADAIGVGSRIIIRSDKTWPYLVAFASDQCVTVIDSSGPREIPWCDVIGRV